MPYYDYRCEQCGEVFEIRASFKEKAAGLDPECPKCHAKRARQMVTTGLLVLGSSGGNPSSPGCGPDARPGCCR